MSDSQMSDELSDDGSYDFDMDDSGEHILEFNSPTRI